jgi:MFS family permease
MTHSPVWLGLVAFAAQVPALLLTPLAGSVIDRTDRRRLLFLTQTIAMGQAFLLALLTLAGVVEVWHVLTLSFILGAVNAFDQPARQALLREMVGTGDGLPNAIALNSSVFNAGRFVGPALAAAVLAVTGPGICFLINGLTFLAVLAALLAMRIPGRQLATRPDRLLDGLRAGLAYAWRCVPIRSLLLLIGLFNMAGMAEATLLPIVAAAALHGDAGTLGLLTAAAGVGAFLAALLLASRRSIQGLDRWMVAAPAAYGLGLVLFSFVRTAAAASLLLSVTGFALLLMTAAANTLLQTIVAEDKRGRVLSLYTMMVTGLAPIGGLLAGVLADAIGAPLTLRVAGLACLAAAATFAVPIPARLAETMKATP